MGLTRLRFLQGFAPPRAAVAAALLTGLLAAGLLTSCLRRIEVDVGFDFGRPLPSPARVAWGAEESRSRPLARVPDAFVPARAWLQVVATGRRNPQAEASQVAILNLPEEGRVRLDPPGSWRRIDTHLWISHRVQPATLTWEGPATRLPRLRLLSGPRAGMAIVHTRGGAEELDLYAPESGKLARQAPVPPEVRPARYHARVPRTAAGALQLRLPEGAPRPQRVLAGGLWPRAFDAEAPVPLPAWQRGGATTFVLLVALLCPLCLGAAGLAAWLLRQLVRPLPDLPLHPFPWRAFLGFLGCFAALYGFFWLCLFPAAMTGDSLWSWEMAQMGKYNDNHPAWHAMTLRFFTRFWNSPGAIIPAQILLLSGAQAWGLALLLRAAVPRGVVLCVFALGLLSLRNALLAVTLWKDVWFTGLFALMLLLLAQLLLSARTRRGWAAWIALGLALGLLPLYRHNGLPLLLAMPALLLLFLFPHWRRVALAAALAFGLFLGIKLGVYRAAEVAPMDGRTWGLFYAWQIAALLDRPLTLAPEEYAFLDRARPFAEGGWDYTPARPMETIYHPSHNYALIAAHEEEFARLYRSLLARYPLVIAHQRLVSTGYLWSPLPRASPMLKGGAYAVDIAENELGLTLRPVLPRVQKALKLATFQSFETPALRELWRPAWHLWAGAAALVALAWRTRRAHWLILGLPIWINTALIVLLTHSPEARYQLPATFTVGMLLGLAWAGKRGSRGAAENAERKPLMSTDEGGSGGAKSPHSPC